jgi:hypothetical protein
MVSPKILRWLRLAGTSQQTKPTKVILNHRLETVFFPCHFSSQGVEQARRKSEGYCGSRSETMRATLHTQPGSFFLFVGAILGALFIPAVAVAAPRPPQPPWPSLGVIHYESFNQPYAWWKTAAVDGSTWTESFSGWALNCQGTAVAPWSVPMVVGNSFRVDPERGAIRFWYRPDFSSGAGPGQIARLATLASGTGKSAEGWWALVVGADGRSVNVLCETETGPAACLSADIKWQAGDWHLLTLGYTPTNSALFLDDQLVATGDGLATVPKELWSLTSLVLGSDLSGALPAQGQFEELTVFSARPRFRRMTGHVFGLGEDSDIGHYYASLSKVAALGPISDAEIAARQARVAAMRAALTAEATLATESGVGGGMQMMLLQGPTSTCNTNAPLYITNTVCAWVANQGWTVTFEIQGTNGPADIFTTTTLGTTNAWTWLENGPTCYTYQYTNQPGTNACYILGTPLDTDGDGLTDAYEKLVSKTNPSLWDTDGDGVSDRDEVVLGTNPFVNEITQTPGRLNYTYTAAGWLRVVFGAGGANFGFDSEGNIQQATP